MAPQMFKIYAYTNTIRGLSSVNFYQDKLTDGTNNLNGEIRNIRSKADYALKNSAIFGRNHALDGGLYLSILTNPDQWEVSECVTVAGEDVNATVAAMRVELEACGFIDIAKQHRRFDSNGKPIADELTAGWSVKPPKTKKGIDALIERFELYTGRDCTKISSKVSIVLRLDSDRNAERYGFKRIPQSRGEVIGWMIEATN